MKFAAVWDEKTRHNRRDRYNPRQEVWFSQGILMHDAHEASSLEQRRKLLKGALAASSVITMGYSGSALASFDCVAKVRVDGGYPAGDFQFTMTDPSLSSSSKWWAWEAVLVQMYQTSGGAQFEGFAVNGNVYPTAVPVTPPRLAVTGATLVSPQPSGYPKAGWVLAYFDDGGTRTGSYPTYTSAAVGQTPATESCLASINPGLTGFTFGG
ncbi:MAG: hypothetical protein EYC67_09970 [Betaproteobacteria bacterium]|nr:MAG: hypothetical protein EYC67_09970 [Betaproteobacteria bacterium]